MIACCRSYRLFSYTWMCTHVLPFFFFVFQRRNQCRTYKAIDKRWLWGFDRKENRVFVSIFGNFCVISVWQDTHQWTASIDTAPLIKVSARRYRQDKWKGKLQQQQKENYDGDVIQVIEVIVKLPTREQYAKKKENKTGKKTNQFRSSIVIKGKSV